MHLEAILDHLGTFFINLKMIENDYLKIPIWASSATWLFLCYWFRSYSLALTKDVFAFWTHTNVVIILSTLCRQYHNCSSWKKNPAPDELGHNVILYHSWDQLTLLSISKEYGTICHRSTCDFFWNVHEQHAVLLSDFSYTRMSAVDFASCFRTHGMYQALKHKMYQGLDKNDRIQNVLQMSVVEEETQEMVEAAQSGLTNLKRWPTVKALQKSVDQLAGYLQFQDLKKRFSSGTIWCIFQCFARTLT